MSLFNELKRRNVFRVGIAYAVVGWLVMQFADVVLNNITAPDWVFKSIMLLLAIGFPKRAGVRLGIRNDAGRHQARKRHRPHAVHHAENR